MTQQNLMAHLVGNICDMLSNFNILEYESVTNDPFTVYLLHVNLKLETWWMIMRNSIPSLSLFPVND